MHMKMKQGNCRTPLLSVLICTYNRAELFGELLKSLKEQTLPLGDFELIIVNDGSSDGTPEVAQQFESMLPMKYCYQKNAGLAAARNHGLYHASAPIVLFLDDDDLASPGLLEEHVATHCKYPAENYAVLGFTGLTDDVSRKPLMHFVTRVGYYLSCYPLIKDGDILDYTYFWGGRTSCKTGLLKKYGIFNPLFTFGCEDIELGFRLSKQGLKVVYNARAESTMIRDIPFESFCNRLIRQGRSQYVFSRVHPDQEIQQWTEMEVARVEWPTIAPKYEAIVSAARVLDAMANQRLELGLELDPTFISLLHQSYWDAFKASKLRGIADVANPTFWERDICEQPLLRSNGVVDMAETADVPAMRKII